MNPLRARAEYSLLRVRTTGAHSDSNSWSCIDSSANHDSVLRARSTSIDDDCLARHRDGQAARAMRERV